ncbi:hypothetical protein SVAN01_01196 [Stagonosporopsis vannaccii]|nr:hypothetical protein SVAN01_01196 [Stagonosporopsis vannaccii]
MLRCAPSPSTLPHSLYRHCVMILTDAASWAATLRLTEPGILRPFHRGAVASSKPCQPVRRAH